MGGLRLLWVVACVVARARCAGGARRAGPVACVESAANAEFAASPLNYAHWLLAHAYPTLVALEAAETWPWAVVRFPLVFGENELLPTWRSQYASLLWPAAVEFAVENATLRTMGGGGAVASVALHGDGLRGRVFEACGALGVGDEACGPVAARLAAVDAAAPAACDARVSVAVPHLAFCDATYWRDAGQVARYLRRRFHTAGSARLLKPRIFVLLRGSERRTAADGEEIGRTWDVGGLEAICGAAALVGRAADAGVDVECGAFDGDQGTHAGLTGNSGYIILDLSKTGAAAC